VRELAAENANHKCGGTLSFRDMTGRLAGNVIGQSWQTERAVTGGHGRPSLAAPPCPELGPPMMGTPWPLDVNPCAYAF